VSGDLADFFMVCVTKSDLVEEFFRLIAGRRGIEAGLCSERISTGLFFSSPNYPVLIFSTRPSMNPVSSGYSVSFSVALKLCVTRRAAVITTL
jgi:hypothetical protein